jgi:hypothetical protein
MPVLLTVACGILFPVPVAEGFFAWRVIFLPGEAVAVLALAVPGRVRVLVVLIMWFMGYG